ncbi:hypothetical protein B0O80DRAFT_495853 [Mortierella sp. GBAus27b]|nr:hypothetical protein BGX31_005758 [Mortierella sp. GBA43]KAI8358073.1 hypothetical protein B0O80DRAFT_495853 [Mortierella sp. GBAus27b]
MSSFLTAIKDYVYPAGGAADTNPSSSNAESGQGHDPKDGKTGSALSPPSTADKISVQYPSPVPTLSVPSVTLSSIQVPTINIGDSDSDKDSDDDSDIPSIVVPTGTTPSMTLSTADAPDESTPNFPAMNGPQRLAACSTDPKSRRRNKFALAPGHSPLDWARLTSSGKDLKGGVPGIGRYTLADVKAHNKPDDAWTVLNGNVYNITPYLPFHPGGEKEILRCAGRDGTRLFNLTHKWVNYEYMLKECLVGFLVSEAPSSYQLSA